MLVDLPSAFGMLLPPDCLTQKVLNAKHKNSFRSCHSFKIQLGIVINSFISHKALSYKFLIMGTYFSTYTWNICGKKLHAPLAIRYHGCMFSTNVAMTMPVISQHQQESSLDEEQLTQAREAGKFGRGSALKRQLKTCLCCPEKIQIHIYYWRQSLRVLLNTSLMLDEWITSVLKNAIFQLLLDMKYLSFWHSNPSLSGWIMQKWMLLWWTVWYRIGIYPYCNRLNAE